MKPYLEGLYVEACPEPELGRPGAGGGQHGLARGAQQQQVAQLTGHTNYVTSVAFDGSGKYLASGEMTQA